MHYTNLLYFWSNIIKSIFFNTLLCECVNINKAFSIREIIPRIDFKDLLTHFNLLFLEPK